MLLYVYRLFCLCLNGAEVKIVKTKFLKPEFFDIADCVKRYLNDEKGSTAIEYGLLASLIGIMMMTGASSLGGNLNQRFTEIGAVLSGPPEPHEPPALPGRIDP